MSRRSIDLSRWMQPREITGPSTDTRITWQEYSRISIPPFYFKAAQSPALCFFFFFCFFIPLSRIHQFSAGNFTFSLSKPASLINVKFRRCIHVRVRQRWEIRTKIFELDEKFSTFLENFTVTISRNNFGLVFDNFTWTFFLKKLFLHCVKCSKSGDNYWSSTAI